MLTLLLSARTSLCGTNRGGRFSMLMETFNYFGIELMDTNLIATKRAFMITGDSENDNNQDYFLLQLFIKFIRDLKMRCGSSFHYYKYIGVHAYLTNLTM